MKSYVHICRPDALAGAGTAMRPAIPDRGAEGHNASRLQTPAAGWMGVE
jgi:hypothetical protein